MKIAILPQINIIMCNIQKKLIYNVLKVNPQNSNIFEHLNTWNFILETNIEKYYFWQDISNINILPKKSPS